MTFNPLFLDFSVVFMSTTSSSSTHFGYNRGDDRSDISTAIPAVGINSKSVIKEGHSGMN